MLPALLGLLGCAAARPLGPGRATRETASSRIGAGEAARRTAAARSGAGGTAGAMLDAPASRWADRRLAARVGPAQVGEAVPDTAPSPRELEARERSERAEETGGVGGAKPPHRDT